MFSAQHDCRFMTCKASGKYYERQERQKTSRTVSTIEHTDDDNFVINMGALHNAGELRNALPEVLIRPHALYSDRKEHHDMLASNLRVSQTAKRKRTNEKRTETRARNKAQKEADKVQRRQVPVAPVTSSDEEMASPNDEA